MRKEFNTTGICIPKINYMVDVTNKINMIIKVVGKGKYIVLNRPRQYGKTTILNLLEKKLIENGFITISISFEALNEEIFNNAKNFCIEFMKMIYQNLEQNEKELSEFALLNLENIENNPELSNRISNICKNTNKKIILMIDEVDKSSNNQLFLNFLGMLRNKYLLQKAEKDITFYSVILVGVHDVKTLKLKILKDEEVKYNSPWNIASKFVLDLGFNEDEISTMLVDYVNETGIIIDIPVFSKKIYFYTSGYPFFVSRLCEIIDLELMPKEKWTLQILDEAVKLLLKESNTNFDDMIKNLENNLDLYEFVSKILLEGEEISFNQHNPIIEKGTVFGILKENKGETIMHNHIYSQIIFNYMSSKFETNLIMNKSKYNFRDNFIQNNKLDIWQILKKFQQFMKEEYSKKNISFIEREGRLLFLAFLKPIINGIGFDFKEIQISEEKRLDIVVTFFDNKYVLELKVWRGKEAHNKGINQLKDYLDKVCINIGYLIIFDFSKNKDKIWTEDHKIIDDKEIFMVRI